MTHTVPVLALVATVAIGLAASHGDAAGRQHTVTIQMAAAAFQPAAVDVRYGDTVRFLQTSHTTHQVEFTFVPAGTQFLENGDDGPASRPPRRIAPLRKPGEQYFVVITDAFAPGAHHYTCANHEHKGMVGVIVVRR